MTPPTLFCWDPIALTCLLGFRPGVGQLSGGCLRSAVAA